MRPLRGRHTATAALRCGDHTASPATNAANLRCGPRQARLGVYNQTFVKDPTMRFIIPLVVDYPANEWASKYALSDADATRDFSDVVRRTVLDGTLTAILNTHWPRMRGHITAHTADDLDPAARDDLRQLLQNAHDADLETALIAEITSHLTDQLTDDQGDVDGRKPRWVTFGTWEWDNGYFLTGTEAVVYFEDGDSLPLDLDRSSVDDLLTDLYGARGARAALGVDLRTSRLEFDDYGDTVPALLGIPAPVVDEDDGDVCDECGATIPADEPSEVSTHHRPSCSLHPSAISSTTTPSAEDRGVGQAGQSSLSR